VARVENTEDLTRGYGRGKVEKQEQSVSEWWNTMNSSFLSEHEMRRYQSDVYNGYTM